ncbi:hypothetical protein LTR66_009829 [Elasticomyces elasticus]|nr:hypothetical protein LTR66_009829 [Elasticomyces elasticus]KAK4986550.1 hypothetical protein LTR50_005234 [Elasticomyces elasticus]
MSRRFDNRVCLITGASSGIGRATAQKLCSLGAILALSDINGEGLSETIQLCGGGERHLLSTFDVGLSEACNAFIKQAMERHGRIDHIFNCAGVNPTAYALEDTTDEYWDKLVNTNLKGTYNITRAALTHLKAGASIVNVSSILGVTASQNYAIYCATKFGIVGFTKAMALELGPKGIRMNAVAPGYIDTPTNSGVVEGPEGVKAMVAKVAMGRLGTADEVADLVAFLFSDESRYINGSIVEINGGIT